MINIFNYFAKFYKVILDKRLKRMNKKLISFSELIEFSERERYFWMRKRFFSISFTVH